MGPFPGPIRCWPAPGSIANLGDMGSVQGPRVCARQTLPSQIAAAGPNVLLLLLLLLCCRSAAALLLLLPLEPGTPTRLFSRLRHSGSVKGPLPITRRPMLCLHISHTNQTAGSCMCNCGCTPPRVLPLPLATLQQQSFAPLPSSADLPNKVHYGLPPWLISVT
jgi:hypothetical protein